MTYDDALDLLATYHWSFGGGLANHGPTAVEALAHMGRDIAPFVERYRQQLEPARRTSEPVEDAGRALRAALGGLVGQAAAAAGHGLLRVAHAVRAIELEPTPSRRRELATGLAYWQRGRGLPGPAALEGSRPLDDVLAALPRLDPARRGSGMLDTALAAAASMPEVTALIGQIEPGHDVAGTLDAVATHAAVAFLAHDGIAAFALLHGVTVSSMAHRLLGYLDPAGQRQLEAAVVGFVSAALVAYDTDRAASSAEPAAAVEPVAAVQLDPMALAARAAASPWSPLGPGSRGRPNPERSTVRPADPIGSASWTSSKPWRPPGPSATSSRTRSIAS